MNNMSQPPNMAQVDTWEMVPVTTNTVPPYTTTNAIFYGRSSFVIIDPGTPHDDQRQILINYIKKRHDRGHKLLAVCLTHHHQDHTSAAVFLAQHFDVPIFAHHKASEHVDFSIDKKLCDGDEINLLDIVLTALDTPGHAPDHLVFFDQPNGILMAGDMITDKGTILIPPNSGSLRIYLKNLESLAKLSIKVILPAHGLAITKNPRQFLLKALEHRYNRIESVLNALAKNPNNSLDATDITTLVYQGTIPDQLLFFAQLSVESSLQWLQDFGLVKKIDYKWQITKTADISKKDHLLDPLEQIQKRLRDA